MRWYWTHDERGEEKCDAQEVLKDLQEFQPSRERGDNPRLALEENIDKFLSTAISSGRINPS